MGFRAVCIESRCKCSYGGGYLVVTKGDATTKIHLSEIASLTFATTQSYVSAYLLSELAKAKVPVVFSDEKYLPVAECLPLHGAYNNSEHVAEQMKWTIPSKKRLWQKVVRDKVKLQACVLDLNGHDREASILRSYLPEVLSGDTTNREAVAAAIYFATLFGEPFNRDLDCPLNASLDYGYAVLLSKVAREIASHGYMTQIGIQHRGAVNPWNLACDFMEPFRPYIDVVVMRTDKDKFDVETRHQLIDIMSNTVSYDGGNYRLGSVVSQYVKDCLDVLNKKKRPNEVKCYQIS